MLPGSVSSHAKKKTTAARAAMVSALTSRPTDSHPLPAAAAVPTPGHLPGTDPPPPVGDDEGTTGDRRPHLRHSRVTIAQIDEVRRCAGARLHPRKGEHEGRPPPEVALDGHAPPHRLDQVLHDRQPEPGAAHLARAARVHPVEALEEPG